MSDVVPLTGEPLALDLVNTRARLPEGLTDLIATPRQLARWLSLQESRLPEFAGAEPTAADLAPIQAVRDHAAAAVEAARHGTRPPPAALRGLTEAQRAAPAVRELRWHEGAVTAVTSRTGPLGVRLAARLAEVVADLLTDPAVTTVRPCEADSCVMLFLPTNPRRRWCTAARCGNRARVARYYRRHK